MDQTSQQLNLPVLEAQIRECYGRVSYTAKTHEKDSDLCTTKLNIIKWVHIILAAITTSGLITAFLGDPKVSWLAMVASVICSTLQLIISTYTKDVDPGQEAANHKITAAELWNVRESYLSLLADINEKSIDLSQIKEYRDQLQAKLFEIYKTAPRTTAKAYKIARKGLKTNEEMTFSVKEIDQLLPEALRKSSN